ncbi:disulfide bond formation protein B [Roseobacter weihaiensis]|uniref:disulfide bond formation protein B n=1 Tax=Roseobacter weihaiensis TaxID=2763262 RepID=UPI001D09B38E|nr:disulfide bond formation protein B [Roseobacter sp. H9]
MTARQTLLIAFMGSGLLLAGAYAFQHLGGMAPCQMCIWQRYPHGIAVAVGALALTVRQKGLLVIGALAAATTSGIGFYHMGVEQGWWQGPSSCSAGAIDGISAEALLDQILAAPLVRCDEIPWQMFGLSMAGWNAVISLALVGFWLMALRRA